MLRTSGRPPLYIGQGCQEVWSLASTAEPANAVSMGAAYIGKIPVLQI